MLCHLLIRFYSASVITDMKPYCMVILCCLIGFLVLLLELLLLLFFLSLYVHAHMILADNDNISVEEKNTLVVDLKFSGVLKIPIKVESIYMAQ